MMIASTQSDRAARPQAYRRVRGIFLSFLTIAALAGFNLPNMARAAEPSKTDAAMEEDVCGLVLVDALTEGLRDAETPEQWAIQR